MSSLSLGLRRIVSGKTGLSLDGLNPSEDLREVVQAVLGHVVGDALGEIRDGHKEVEIGDGEFTGDELSAVRFDHVSDEAQVPAKRILNEVLAQRLHNRVLSVRGVSEHLRLHANVDAWAPLAGQVSGKAEGLVDAEAEVGVAGVEGGVGAGPAKLVKNVRVRSVLGVCA